MNTGKQPQKKNDHYNLKSKGAPPTLGKMQEKMRQLMRKANPLATWKQETLSKSGKTAADKSTSMRSKLQNTPLDNTNIHSTPDTSVIQPLIDYDIVEDMKNQANIILFKLAKV